MKVLNVTEVARNFRSVMDGVENHGDEIVLVRNRKAIASILPEAPEQNALEVFGDLYRMLDERTADALAGGLRRARASKRGRLRKLRNPWAS